MSPLSHLPVGSQVELDTLHLSDVITLRMNEMGITPKSLITVLNNRNKGPVIIQCRDAKIALHRDIAENMIVNIIEKGEENGTRQN